MKPGISSFSFFHGSHGFTFANGIFNKTVLYKYLLFTATLLLT